MDKNKYAREYMRKWLEKPENAEKQRKYSKARYARLKNDPRYIDMLHRNRLNHFKNYLETFGYTVIPPMEGKNEKPL